MLSFSSFQSKEFHLRDGLLVVGSSVSRMLLVTKPLSSQSLSIHSFVVDGSLCTAPHSVSLHCSQLCRQLHTFSF